MPRVPPYLKAIPIALALALSLAGAASTAANAAVERSVRANLAANPGSVRVGPDRIRLAPGLTMMLHRGFATASQPPGHTCNQRYFCIYENRDFGGASLAMSACKTYILHHYRFIDRFGRPDRWDLEASSWINNQVGGAVATLTHRNGNTFKAPIGHDRFLNPPWNDRVVRVKPC